MQMEFNQALSLAISIFALAVSALTMWLTLFYRGRLCMTQPSVIFFGPDGGNSKNPKIFLRSLLYSTSKRGFLIETIFAKVKRGETQQNFNIWVYGEDRLARGSGLFVGQEGVVVNHHFLLPKDGANFEFKQGDYCLEIFARIAGLRTPKQLLKLNISISENQQALLSQGEAGIYFDWGPDAGRYQSHVEHRPVPTPKQGYKDELKA